MFKKQEGITLVALVITIIVLLILAGVSISLVVGNNGVLTQASGAVKTNEKATALQEVQMGAADAQTAYYTAWATNSSKHKGEFYKVTTIQNSCQGGTVTFTEPDTTADTGDINVTYKAKSDASYTFKINIATGAVTE